MDEEKVYQSAKTYWESVPATVSGMLDGFTQINSIDLSESNKFIRQFFQVRCEVIINHELLGYYKLFSTGELFFLSVFLFVCLCASCLRKSQLVSCQTLACWLSP